MFKLNFKSFFDTFKLQENHSKDSIVEESKDTLYVEFANNFISYKLNTSHKIETINLTIQSYKNFDEIFKIWNEALGLIIESLKIKPNLVIYITSSKFLIKNSDKFLKHEAQIRYFASKLALDENSIEVLQLKDNSYFIVECKFLQNILFAFKDYNVKDIYDLSLLNSFHTANEKLSLYIDISLNTFDIVLNHIKIQKRSLKNNLSTFVENCASVLYVDFETSYNNIQLNFKDVTTYQELESTNKLLHKKLKEFIDKLVDDIQNTLSYFSVHENIEYIEKIYINGDILEFDFIIKILSTKLDIDFIPFNKYAKMNSVSKTNLTLVNYLDKAVLKKLHIDFDGLNYNDGRDEYIFIENRFISKGTLTTSQKTKIDTKKQQVRIDSKKQVEQKSLLKMDMSEIFAYIKDEVFTKNKSDISSDTNIKVHTNFIIYASIFLITSICLIFLFNFVSKSYREFDNHVITLEDRIARVDNIKKELIKRNQEINMENDEETNKRIFWTQKIIILANLMPKDIWLSSVSIENNVKNIEKKEVTGQVMVLEAKALPSAMGHISNIAQYMDKLLHADNDFKKDFSDITFGGATIIQESGNSIVEFKLLCNFEKNIHIKDMDDKQNSQKDKSIVENLHDINKNTQLKEKILNDL